MASGASAEAAQRGRRAGAAEGGPAGQHQGLHRGWQIAPGITGVRPPRGGLQEPALARGYADGYEQGLSDGREGNRYDPVKHREYRSGDLGYERSYGTRDAYKNNYRAGFRQGYEEGYRDGTGRR
jgi:flagellar biosynthesis/type III secretory pathway protein FliH